MTVAPACVDKDGVARPLPVCYDATSVAIVSILVLAITHTPTPPSPLARLRGRVPAIPRRERGRAAGLHYGSLRAAAAPHDRGFHAAKVLLRSARHDAVVNPLSPTTLRMWTPPVASHKFARHFSRVVMRRTTRLHMTSRRRGTGPCSALLTLPPVLPRPALKWTLWDGLLCLWGAPPHRLVRPPAQRDELARQETQSELQGPHDGLTLPGPAIRKLCRGVCRARTLPTRSLLRSSWCVGEALLGFGAVS